MEALFKINVHSFWVWFSTISDELYNDFYIHEILEELDSKILRLGDFSWEIGFTQDDKAYLSISAGIAQTKIDESNFIIENSPQLAKWSFFNYRLKKEEWNGELNLITKEGKQITVNTSNWKCILFQYEDNLFDVEVLLEANRYSSEILISAIQTSIINLIGEDIYIKYLREVTFVDESASEYIDRSFPLHEISSIIPTV